MSGSTQNTTRHTRDDETLARLFRLAGESRSIPSDIESRVYDSVYREWAASTTKPDSERVYRKVRREWRRTTSTSMTRRWSIPAALAASVALLALLFVQPTNDVATQVPVGTIVKMVGTATDTQFVDGNVYPGMTLRTRGNGGISVSLQNAQSLRLDANSEIVINAIDAFTLVAGRVYVDTGDFMYRNKGVVIETQFGEVADVGTQFSVDVSSDGLDVAVREGRVDVQSNGKELVAVAGERLRVAQGEAAQIDMLEPHDVYWDWVADLAPVYDLENRSLLDFLRWAARETGRELVFEDNELRMAAMRTDLHGSVADFTPVEAVQAVMSTTSFRYRIEPDRIVIFRK